MPIYDAGGYLRVMATKSFALDLRREGQRVNKQVNSDAAAASLVVSATPALLVRLHVMNTGAAVNYVQIHDAASLPANASVPLATFAVAAHSDRQIEIPFVCQTGIVVAGSSTEGTLTSGGTIMATALIAQA